MLIAMVSIQPAISLCSLAMAIAVSISFSGLGTTLRRSSWAMPMAIAIAIINGLISHGSANELGLGWFSISIEGLLYGSCMGLMLAEVTLIIMAGGDAVSIDDAMSLTKGRAPTISLMLSMSLATIVRLRKTVTEVAEVEQANPWMSSHDRRCYGAHGDEGARKVRSVRRQSRRMNAMLDVAMDDSQQAVQAIKSRGWGSGPRTSFCRVAFRSEDAVWLALDAIIGVAAVASCALASHGFSFYPQVSWDELSSVPSIVGVIMIASYAALGYARYRHA